MADYWKSQPKKFCQYCKCWIADNKPSVEFHERGKNHKENVAAKITEIKQKSLDKAKQEARMSKDFATMEEAALKAYEEDIKRIAMESGSQAQMTTTTTSTTTTKTAAKTAAKTKTVTVLVKPPPHQQEKSRKGARAKKRKQAQAEQEAWVEGRTEDGHTYFYNSVTGESKWDRPEGFQGDSNTAQLGHSESSSDGAWMEAASPEGYMYYYNKETGESSWVRPAHLPPREMEWQPEPPGTQQTAHADGKERSEAEQAPAEAESNGQASQHPVDSRSSLEQRKAETEPTEKEGDKGAVAVVIVVDDDQKRDVGEQKEDAGEEKPAEEVQKPPPVAEPEKKPKIVIQVRKTRMANAYGAWEKIKQEVDPYVSVDLQLPQVDTASMAEALPPAPKPKSKFRERTITSLGQEGGPASFKKSKMQNGKSRSLRQRGKDE